MSAPRKKVLLLCGGVGGAKLAHGFEQLPDEVESWVLVNVGDDFEHLGLAISPDLDTVLYTLGGIANREQGWGIQGESWRTLERLKSLGGESWFRLGDLDLATHLFRTASLADGQPLSEVAASLARNLQIKTRILPASDQRLRTRVQTDLGELDFQHYFVREQCRPKVTAITFEGASAAGLPSALVEDLEARPQSFDAVIIAPSNPFLSIAPILAVPGMSELLRQAAPRVVAVSPIIKGQALKGPAAKLMAELGLPVSASGWAMYLRDTFEGLIDEWILDASDSIETAKLTDAGFSVRTGPTIMTGPQERRALAAWLLDQVT